MMMIVCAACAAVPPPAPSTVLPPTPEPVETPDGSRRVELFYTDVVALPDGMECAVAGDTRICFRDDEPVFVARDLGREWTLEAYHREGTLFRDQREGTWFRAPIFTGELEPAPSPPARREWSERLRVDDRDRLVVWDGHGFLPAELPGRVIRAAGHGRDVAALVEPGQIWSGRDVRGVMTWSRARWLRPDSIGLLNERAFDQLQATSSRLQHRINRLLANGELVVAQSGERRLPPRRRCARGVSRPIRRDRRWHRPIASHPSDYRHTRPSNGARSRMAPAWSGGDVVRTSQSPRGRHGWASGQTGSRSRPRPTALHDTFRLVGDGSSRQRRSGRSCWPRKRRSLAARSSSFAGTAPRSASPSAFATSSCSGRFTCP